MKSLRWLPAVLWMAVIFWLSAQTGSELGSMFPFVEAWFPFLDGFNFGHFIAYFILAVLFWWAIGSDRLSMKLLVIAMCLTYGLTDEFHQRFVEGRTPDLMDIRNDTIGATLAMIVVSIPPIRRLLRKIQLP